MKNDMLVGEKVYSIEDRKVVTYTVTQKVTTETIQGTKTEYFVENSGVFKTVSKKKLEGMRTFTDKHEADSIVALINEFA
jgi:hypothetical protein